MGPVRLIAGVFIPAVTGGTLGDSRLFIRVGAGEGDVISEVSEKDKNV